MTKGQRTIATLLAIVAVLLAVNIVVNLLPQSARLVGLATMNEFTLRLWSDGRVEVRETVIDGSGNPIWNTEWLDLGLDGGGPLM